MMVKKLLFAILFFNIANITAQVGIGTVAPASTLDVVGQPTVVTVLDGVIAPRLTGAQLRAKTYTVAQTGALVYATAADTAPAGQTINVTAVGYYCFNGILWVTIANGNSDGWKLLGNAGTIAGTSFFGTTDNQDLIFKRNNVVSANIKVLALSYGVDALNLLSTGNYNTAIGNNSLKSNTSGYNNLAVGESSLYNNTSGNRNVASGFNTLFYNTTGNTNTANGYESLYNNTTGDNNTASGFQSLFKNSIGYNNTATGQNSLYNNTSGYYNTANGYASLYNNTTGHHNTAIGLSALYTNTTGNQNVATGQSSLYSNTTGHNNIAMGQRSLFYNTIGILNTSIGTTALFNNTIGSYRTALGHDASSDGADYDNSMGLGYNARPTAANVVHVGNTSITWIGGQVGWSTYSDARIKNNVQENVSGLPFILKLRPITYNIDKDKQDELLGIKDEANFPKKYAINNIKQSGFLAQEVEVAAKESGYDFSGIHLPNGDVKLYSVTYAEFVVPLVKAIQEQQNIIEASDLKIKKLEEINKHLEARLKTIEEKLLKL